MSSASRRLKMPRQIRFRGMCFRRCGMDVPQFVELTRRNPQPDDHLDWTYKTRGGGVVLVFSVPYPTRFDVPIQWRIKRPETLRESDL